jgi:hypothetical protein
MDHPGITGADFPAVREALKNSEVKGHRIKLAGDLETEAFAITGKRVRIEGEGAERTIKRNADGTLVTIHGGAELTLGAGLTLNGNKPHTTGSVVDVRGGHLLMEDGSAITGGFAENGGGVNMTGGRFTMNGGRIYGNTAAMFGGGVYINGGVFAMMGGTIYGKNEGSNSNTAAVGDVVYNSGA